MQLPPGWDIDVGVTSGKSFRGKELQEMRESRSSGATIVNKMSSSIRYSVMLASPATVIDGKPFEVIIWYT